MQPAHNLRLTTYQIKSIRGNTQEIWKRNEREHTKFIVHVTHELKEEETKEKIERGIEIQSVWKKRSDTVEIEPGTLTKRDRKRIPGDVRHDRQIEGQSDERRGRKTRRERS